MSERALATFLHTLLADAPRPVGPIRDPVLFERLVAQPSAQLQNLLVAHSTTVRADLPGSEHLDAAAIPATTLWVGAALNNLALSATRPDKRTLTVTLRLTEALPPATSPAAALAYHSLLRHLVRWPPTPEWQPVAHRLLARSPLTALWQPHIGEQTDWNVMLALLACEPLRILVRDRLLGVLPPPERFQQQHLDTQIARANATTGRILGALLEHGGAAWQPWVLAFYEADCARQRRGTEAEPVWPLLTWVRRAQRQGDALTRRNVDRVLARYVPLGELMRDEMVVRPYLQLDGRFMEQLGQVLPTRKRFQRLT
jgi:hypothetical protein